MVHLNSSQPQLIPVLDRLHHLRAPSASGVVWPPSVLSSCWWVVAVGPGQHAVTAASGTSPSTATTAADGFMIENCGVT